MDTRIIACQTMAELTALENMYVLSKGEQRLVCANSKKVEIISRLLECCMENKKYGSAANLSDSWTPEQRQRFMLDCNDDEFLREVMPNEDLYSLTQQWSSEKRESFLLDWNDDEPLLQIWVMERNDRLRTMALRRAQLKTTLL